MAVDVARRVFDNEIAALCSVRDSLDDTFEAVIAEVIGCEGKIIVTGMGKSGHIARKVASTLASLGSCAIFLHPGECLHGDLGMIQAQDLVVAISYSGESDEIIRIIPGIREIGAKLICITGNGSSTLARNSTLTQVFPYFSEACSLDLAPTSSTTAALVYGDALAVAASEAKGFGKSDFRALHPAGALGKSLTLRVVDCMRRMPIGIHLLETSTISEAFQALCTAQWEILPVSNASGKLIGELHVSSIKDALSRQDSIYKNTIKEFVVTSAVFVNADEMAIDALRVMKRSGVDAVITVKDSQAVGLLRREDLLRQGLSV